MSWALDTEAVSGASTNARFGGKTYNYGTQTQGVPPWVLAVVAVGVVVWLVARERRKKG
jgi:hypothetical protein